MNLRERVLMLHRMYTPHLPEPRFTCSWSYTGRSADGKHEVFKCTACGDVQVVNDLLGQMETRTCKGSQ